MIEGNYLQQHKEVHRMIEGNYLQQHKEVHRMIKGNYLEQHKEAAFSDYIILITNIRL